MLCGCLETLVGPAPGNHGSVGGFGGSFPGCRNNGPFVATGGNALAAYDANVHGNASGGMGQMVAVTVPPGMSPGQTLQVAAPDGSGRMVQANVPAGAMPGSTFMVQFPANTTQQPPAMAQTYGQPAGPSLDAGLNLPHPVLQQPITTAAGTTNAESLPTATAVADPAGGKASPPPSAAQGGYDGVAVLQPPATPPPLASVSAPVPPPGEKLIMVEVPPGTSAGTPLHVQVPGEDRTIMATVPPGNVKQFHVSYKPSAQSQHATQQQLQQPPGAPSGASPPTIPNVPPGQKLILVNVPPGTAAGSTLHVQVPGENRILAASVPHGNVQSFHVAYTPQQPSGTTAQQMQSSQQRPQTAYDSGHSNHGYTNGSRPQNQGGSGMMGSVAPVVAGAAGAALMGAAAYSMFHHSSGGAGQGGDNAQYVDDSANAAYPTENDEAQVDDSGGADFEVADY